VVTHRHLATIQLRTRRAKNRRVRYVWVVAEFFLRSGNVCFWHKAMAIATAFSSGGLLRSSPSPTKVPPLVPARREPRRLGSGCQIETGATMIGVLLACACSRCGNQQPPWARRNLNVRAAGPCSSRLPGTTRSPPSVLYYFRYWRCHRDANDAARRRAAALRIQYARTAGTEFA
jgi:hypothetical protein